MAKGYAQEFSDEEKEKALKLIEQLEADSFADREAAVDELEKLPVSALPWLDEMIDHTRPTELELRSRLKSIVRSLKKRDAETSLRDGTATTVKLQGAQVDEFLEELELQNGSRLGRKGEGSIWKEKESKDIDFSGTYWEAVDHLFELFPPPAGEREAFSVSDYRFTSWTKADFFAGTQPSVNAGILRVRHGRFALENSGGKDRLVLTLVPSVEPRYQVDELAILIKGIGFEDGTVLEPEDKVCRFETSRNSSSTRYNPVGSFTWVFPLEKGVSFKGAARVEAIADLEVRRLDWVETDLPEDLNEKVEMSSAVDFQVLEREEGRLKIEFEGSGQEPEHFDDYRLRDEAYKLFDADGNELEFNVNSTSSGGGGMNWRISFGGKIDGEAVRIRSRLPGGKQKVQMKFELDELPLPGSSLVEE